MSKQIKTMSKWIEYLEEFYLSLDSTLSILLPDKWYLSIKTLYIHLEVPLSNMPIWQIMAWNYEYSRDFEGRVAHCECSQDQIQ